MNTNKVNRLFFSRYPSPMGEIVLGATEKGLYGCWLDPDEAKAATIGLDCVSEANPFLDQARAWLDAYFAGTALPEPPILDIQGTPFQKQVWALIGEIPYGKTASYGDLAVEIASERSISRMSAQAVGQAVGKNRICLFIPCHRVIAAGNKIGGFSAGIDRKIWLLEHEKDVVLNNG